MVFDFVLVLGMSGISHSLICREGTFSERRCEEHLHLWSLGQDLVRFGHLTIVWWLRFRSNIDVEAHCGKAFVV